MEYYINKKVNDSFDNAKERITESLKGQGFGVLTEIKIDEKLKEKMNVDFRKYSILGACNPNFAHKALQHEDKIGTMLPCNVIIQELKPGEVEIAAVDPIASMQAVENENLAGLASEVRDMLEMAVDNA